jgi:hypothetical protein
MSEDSKQWLINLIREKTGTTEEITVTYATNSDNDTYKIGEDGAELNVKDLLYQYGFEEAVEETAEQLKKIPDAINIFSKKMGPKGSSFEKLMSDKEGQTLSGTDLTNLQNSLFGNQAEFAEVWKENREQLIAAFGS